MKNKGILILTFFLSLIFMFCGTATGPDDDVIDTSDSTAPSIPIGLAVDENSSIEDSIKISWKANIDDDFDKYRVYRATGADSLPLYELISETRLTYHIDAGMEYNTNYYYRISAVDKNTNESEKSVAVLGITVNINPPVIPTAFTVYAYNLPGEVPTVEVRWTANTESDLHHYSIYRHTTLQLTTDSSYFIAQTTSNSYIDTDVEVGTKYYYRITAVDKGLLASNAVNAKSDTPLPQPSLNYPANGHTTETLRPTFGWERIVNAAKYEVVVQTSLYSGEYWRGEVAQPGSGDIVEAGYPSSPALQYSTKYYWRVAVFSSDNTAANTYSDSTWYFWTPSSK
ncbi:hypothetical protein KJ762_13030 [bacterium]|nr:hypothetical protein [bacterium]MBU1065434.1 hypothetical protein [bacterium]MBU1635416.1 hypothetical protein [bacterium]MBU1874400.1 hypothetical protein [bacterium]